MYQGCVKLKDVWSYGIQGFFLINKWLFTHASVLFLVEHQLETRYAVSVSVWLCGSPSSHCASACDFITEYFALSDIT